MKDIYMAKNYRAKLFFVFLMVASACFAMEDSGGGSARTLATTTLGLPAPDRTGPLVHSQQIYALVTAAQADLPYEDIETLPHMLQAWVRPLWDAHQLFTPQGRYCVQCTAKVYEDGPQGDARFQECFMPDLSHKARQEHGIPDCVLDRIALSAPIVAEALFELLKRDNGEQILDENTVKMQLAAKAYYLNNLPMLVSLYRMGMIPEEWVREFRDRYLVIR
jgi:hypothetical protein